MSKLSIKQRVNLTDCLIVEIFVFDVTHQQEYTGRCGRDRMVVGFTTFLQSMPITADVVTSNHVQAGCTRYNIM